MKKICLAASLLVTSFASVGADLNTAEQLLAGGQADAALLEVESVLADEPNNADARFIQGIALAQLGRNDGAISVFRDLTNDFREIPEPYNNLAVLLAKNGDYAAASDALEEAVKYHPNYTVAWENLADIYSVMATLAYEKVLAQDPTNAAAKQRLAAMSGAVNTVTATPKPYAANKPPQADTLAAVPILPVAPAKQAEAAAEPATAAPEQPPRVIEASSAQLNPQQKEVMVEVNRWAQAWSLQQVDDYINAYSSNYQPQDNQTREDWEQQRRSRLAKPSKISLQLSQPSVAFLDDDLAMVKFVQDYRSDSYQDSVRKTLLMERENGNWRIVREQSIR